MPSETPFELFARDFHVSPRLPLVHEVKGVVAQQFVGLDSADCLVAQSKGSMGVYDFPELPHENARELVVRGILPLAGYEVAIEEYVFRCR